VEQGEAPADNLAEIDSCRPDRSLADVLAYFPAAPNKRLKGDGYEPVLKHSRWVLLKRPENLTEQQAVKLKELLRFNLKAVRAYLLREQFHRFWEYRSVYWAGRFLQE
jgi:transposase